MPYLFFRLEILKKILVVVAISVTYRWGIIGMIYGQIVISCLAYFLNTYYTGKMLDYPITEQIKDLIPSLMISAMMGCGVYALHYAPVQNYLSLLLLQIIAGVLLYPILCYIFKVSTFMKVIEMAKSSLVNLQHANE